MKHYVRLDDSNVWWLPPAALLLLAAVDRRVRSLCRAGPGEAFEINYTPAGAAGPTTAAEAGAWAVNQDAFLRAPTA